MPPSARGTRAFLLALLAAVALCYAPGLANPPAIDDEIGALHNANFPDPGRMLRAFRDPNPPSPAGIPTPGYAYRPLTELSFYLNLRLLPPTENPIRALRAVNLLLHFGGSILVFLIARRFSEGRTGLARWAALWFAVHPLAVQAVGYVYQRSVSLGAFLGFLALALFWSTRACPSPWRSWRYWTAFLAALLAMGAKETSVTLPLTLGAAAWILREPEESLPAILKRWLPFALLPSIVLVQILRLKALHEAAGGKGMFTRAETGFEPLDYLRVQLPILLGYLRLHGLPFPLRFHFDRMAPGPGAAPRIPATETCLCAAALIALGAWTLFGARRHRLARLGTALIFTPLALECSVFPIQDAAWLYRCYPGLLGSGLLFGLAMSRMGLRSLVPGAAALGLLSGLAIDENLTWSSIPRLLARDVRHAFHDGAGWGSYAGTLLEQGDAAGAERLYRRSLASPWQIAQDRTGHAQALLTLGRREEALAEIEQARKDFKDNPYPAWLAVQQLRKGEDARAEMLARQSENIQGLHPEHALWLGRRLMDRGQAARAEKVLRDDLRYFPGYPPLWESLGKAFLLQERWDEAEAALRRALSLPGGLPQARYNLGVLLLRRGDPNGAEAEFREALRLKPNYPVARAGLERLRALRAPEASDAP